MPACPARLFAFLVFYNSIYSNGRRQRKNHRTGRDKEREKETKAETEEDREKEGAEICYSNRNGLQDGRKRKTNGRQLEKEKRTGR